MLKQSSINQNVLESYSDIQELYLNCNYLRVGDSFEIKNELYENLCKQTDWYPIELFPESLLKYEGYTKNGHVKVIDPEKVKDFISKNIVVRNKNVIDSKVYQINQLGILRSLIHFIETIDSLDKSDVPELIIGQNFSDYFLYNPDNKYGIVLKITYESQNLCYEIVSKLLGSYLYWDASPNSYIDFLMLVMTILYTPNPKSFHFPNPNSMDVENSITEIPNGHLYQTLCLSLIIKIFKDKGYNPDLVSEYINLNGFSKSVENDICRFTKEYLYIDTRSDSNSDSIDVRSVYEYDYFPNVYMTPELINKSQTDIGFLLLCLFTGFIYINKTGLLIRAYTIADEKGSNLDGNRLNTLISKYTTLESLINNS